jgi:alkylmercury lyase
MLMEIAAAHNERTALDRDALVRLFVEAFPTLDAGGQRAALALYRLLADARSVPPANLANTLDRPVEDIKHLLDRWPGVFYDAGRIVGFWGLTIKETPHRLAVNGHTVYAWCAWDTLWLPALLDATVNVTSRCAQTGEPVRLRVSPARIESAEPASVVVSFLEPDVGELRSRATTSFCHFVHFFRDREAGERWTAAHPETFLLSRDAAFDIGRRVNAVRYPKILSNQGDGT